ncbi:MULTISPECIES: MFS transporter [unclassified Acidiplasma]|uniref:MFS transporter n=1 Tax=unclassified Acidiplasma TaxID=2641301 RepID=UPI00064E40EF|nr:MULTISPECIES: MFS transporter [unclassified Acidiplasma]WMT54214.1 MAG: MFS transporter [Acidiplasma sp.]
MNNANSKLIFINLIILLSVTFTMRASTNMLMTVVPVFSKYVLLANLIFVGLTATLYGIGALISNILINGRVNISKTPKMITLFLFIMTASIFAFIFTKNIYEVLVLSFITGSSMGVVQPLLMTVTNIISPPDKRDRYIAAYTASLSLSLIFGVLLQGYVISFLTIRYAFVIFFFISLASSILMLILSGKIKISSDNKKIGFREILSKASYSLKQGKVLFAMFGNISYAFPFILLLTYGSIMGREYYGINPDIFFYFLAVFFSISFASRMFLSLKTVKNRDIIMYASFILSIAGYAMLGLTDYIYVFIIGLIFLGIPHGTIYPISSYYIATSIDIKYLNIVYSVFTFIMDVIFFFIPFVFGLISDLYSVRMAIYATIFPMAALIIASIIFNVKSGTHSKGTATKL